MSDKVVNSIFFGVLLFFILDIIFFIGLKSTYLEHYSIKEFFNPFFIDHQNIFIFLPLSFILGYLTFVSRLSKIFFIIYGLLFLCSFTVFIKPIGLEVGEFMFMKKGVSITETNGNVSKYDIIYEGRRYLYLQKDRNSIVIVVDKEKQISR